LFSPLYFTYITAYDIGFIFMKFHCFVHPQYLFKRN